MFDRGSRSEATLNVEIILADGSQLSGKLVVPAGRTLSEVLNGSSAFIEFEPVNQPRAFIAKLALQRVQPLS